MCLGTAGKQLFSVGKDVHKRTGCLMKPLSGCCRQAPASASVGLSASQVPVMV